MFDNEFPPLGGGTGVVNFHLLQEMAKRPDLAVDLVTSARSRDRYECERFAERITLHKVPVDNRNIHHATNMELIRYSRRGLRVALRLLRQHHYDVSFAFAGVPAGALSYVLNLTHRVPYVVSLQGPDVPGFEARYDYLYPFLKPVIKRIWRRAAAVTAISAEQVAMARQTMPELNPVTIPNGVDTETFAPGTAGRRPAINLICAARLIERKGQHHLLQAVARLRGRCARPVRATLVGTGDAESMLRELAEHLHITDRVDFKGFVLRERMPEMYREADIFVLPSQQEGMSIALLEAMASGLPVVVTETGGTAELVTHNGNGKIVPWADVATLSAALKELVDNDGVRKHFGAESRRRAIRFGWPALTARYVDLCVQVAKGATTREGIVDASGMQRVTEDLPREFRA